MLENVILKMMEYGENKKSKREPTSGKVCPNIYEQNAKMGVRGVLGAWRALGHGGHGRLGAWA